jgi:hypothetical protein
LGVAAVYPLELAIVRQDDRHAHDQRDVTEQADFRARIQAARRLAVAGDLQRVLGVPTRGQPRLDDRAFAADLGALPGVLVAERKMQIELILAVEGVHHLRDLARLCQDERLRDFARLIRPGNSGVHHETQRRQPRSGARAGAHHIPFVPAPRSHEGSSPDASGARAKLSTNIGPDRV